MLRMFTRRLASPTGDVMSGWLGFAGLVGMVAAYPLLVLGILLDNLMWALAACVSGAAGGGSFLYGMRLTRLNQGRSLIAASPEVG